MVFFGMQLLVATSAAKGIQRYCAFDGQVKSFTYNKICAQQSEED